MKRSLTRSGKVWIALSALLCCCACGVAKEKHAAVVDSHTSMNAIDWAGTYKGTLPCADCAGIETILTLTPARTYVLHSRYMGRQKVGDEFVHSGVFAWSLDGRSIELMGLKDGHTQFQVGENKLFALDQAGTRIDGALAEAYTLTRSAAIRAEDLHEAVNVFAGGTPWYLVELQGKALASQESAPWLVFETDPARVYGFSGCNRFFGAYQTGADKQQVVGTAIPLKFDSMGTTMMACPPAAMEYEVGFLAMLAQVARVYIERKLEPEEKTKVQNWWDGSVLVFVDSSHRVIARLGAEADM